MSAQRKTVSGRAAYWGCSQATLLMGMMLAGNATAASVKDYRAPELPIRTNRYAAGLVSSGGPGPDIALSSPLQGVPVELGSGSERSSPENASPDPITGTSARSAIEAAAETGAVAEAQASPRTARVYTAIDVPLMLNGRFLGMISADVDMQGDGLVDAQRFFTLIEPVLTAESLAALRQAATGLERIPFDDLDVEGFSLEFSSTTLELRATITGEGMNPTSLSMGGVRTPPDPSDFVQPARFSAGANLSIAQQYLHNDGQSAPLRGAIDGIANWGGFGGVTLITGAEYDDSRRGSGWRRSETRLVKDFYSSAIRAVAGEFTPIADGFQGSGRIVGLGMQRAYSVVRPFQNIRPTGRQEFTLEREATIDVIVNGLPTQTLRLPPGRYSVSDFMFGTGANQVQLVVDDVTGRNEIAVFDVFGGAELLGAGVLDFGLAAGRYEGSIPFEYDGPLLATGFLRKGVTGSLTLGMNAQASSDVQQLGGTAIWGSRLGLLLVELSASHDRVLERTGTAASVSYRHNFSAREKNDLRVTANVMATSRDFSDVFQPYRSNVEAWRASALVQWNTPWAVGLSLGVGLSEARQDERIRHQIDLGVSRSFGRINLISNLSFTNAQDQDEVRFSVGLSVPLGGRWNAQASYDTTGNRSEVILGRYSTGALNDLSGEVRFIDDDRAQNLSGRVDYIHNRFEAQLSHNRRTDQLQGRETVSESTLAVRSFIGFAGGSFGFGRPIVDAFILAPVHGSLKDSTVTFMSGSRAVARSGPLGPAIIPIQRSYGVNAFNILVDPLPVGYDLGTGNLTVFPSFGSGYRLQVGSDASRIAVGVLMGSDGPLVLATGTVMAEGGIEAEARPFFTNRAGRFVADRLAPGRYVIFINGNEVARFEIPQSSEGIHNVGTLQISRR